jgi:OOP family OmpA-OmpF porin
MFKKTVFVSLFALAISSPALAIEIPADAGVGFSKEATAYPSTSFNKLLEACGVNLASANVASVPASYAQAADGTVVFNDMDTAYTPTQYHSIFTSYGLVFNPDKIGTVPPSYATVKGGEVVFGDAEKIAYTGDEWTRIYAAYELPGVAMEGDADGDGVVDSKDRCPDTPKGAKVNEDGCWVYSDILFDFDKAVLKEQFKSELDETKVVFDQNPDLQVTVEGHTDSTGSDAYNQKLSERRAKAVVRYLEQNVGVDPSRLSAVGYGESKPVASNDTAEGRAKNRRVEFTPNRR